MRIDGSESQQVTTLPLAGYHNYGDGFCWSPDGGQLLYSHYNQLYRINRNGAGMTQLAIAPEEYHFKAVDWSGVNDKVVVQAVSTDIGDTKMYLMNKDGSGWDPLLDSVSGRIECPSFSIDGKRVLFTQDVSGFASETGHQLDARIFTIDLASRNMVDISVDKPEGFNDLNPHFSPNGARIVFKHTSNEENALKEIWVMDRDGQNRQRLFINAEMPEW
ncbi:TolB family protein [Catalinimonas niigatensis]|uniref:TolB family protein n=1 Tax=Catalinimonas niigatensis TaxID=1397264 RepID=UPI002665DE24|nr:hypothetical protein [Catalinimonas niigatensis]WPP49759.1 hypothetical protein PZB72_24100 [Catalinimonas niigatensis]